MNFITHIKMIKFIIDTDKILKPILFMNIVIVFLGRKNTFDISKLYYFPSS